ncbi:PREDICTED: laminin subunit alpha-5 [Condylura cristata]|uniref:laminin subunit alpha-5 n=1 Tax=Condylura cristata TaxID=143302 RepID=UPI000643B613|nr:PREDICTED: laminin subunit alpha-5 [Condylura cristata]
MAARGPETGRARRPSPLPRAHIPGRSLARRPRGLGAGPGRPEGRRQLRAGQYCDICTAASSNRAHPASHAVDGTERWWQSPPLSRGLEYNEVNVTLDLGQVFHVAYVLIKFANSPRPDLWVLERSTDFGHTYQPWQFFASSRRDCLERFGPHTLERIARDDDVICTTEYSRIVPLENGEVGGAGAASFQNTPAGLQLALPLRTNTLLGHLMGKALWDPTVTRRYYYSIKDISIGGRCVCHGHADVCDAKDPSDPFRPAGLPWPCAASPAAVSGAAPGVPGPPCAGGLAPPRPPGPGGPGLECPERPPLCPGCNCESNFTDGTCEDLTGRCYCRPSFTGERCDACAEGFGGFPHCLPVSSLFPDDTGEQVLPAGQIVSECPTGPAGQAGGQGLRPGEGPRAGPLPLGPLRGHGHTADLHGCGPGGHQRNEAGRSCQAWPQLAALAGSCHPAGLAPANPARPEAQAPCVCRAHVDGPSCDRCRPGFWGLSSSNPEGCSRCSCDPRGTLGGAAQCQPASGQCFCKPHVCGRTCAACKDGFFGLDQADYFGCRSEYPARAGVRGLAQLMAQSGLPGQSLWAAAGISALVLCLGKVLCAPPHPVSVTPRACASCAGAPRDSECPRPPVPTPPGAPVRSLDSARSEPQEAPEAKRPRAGQPLQPKIVARLNVTAPDLFRLVFRFANRGPGGVSGRVSVREDSAFASCANCTEQSQPVAFPPSTEPAFVTVPQRGFGEPFVLNPGAWALLVEAEGVLLDYVVLLPSAYYEAALLQLPVTEACTHRPNAQRPGENCLLYTHLSLDGFPSASGLEASCHQDNGLPRPCRPEQLSPEHPPLAACEGSDVGVQLQVAVPRPGRYALVVEYANEDGRQEVDVAVHGPQQAPQQGTLALHPCPYSTLCRGTALDARHHLMSFYLDTEASVRLTAEQAHFFLGTVVFTAQVPALGRYAVLLHGYQPAHPTFPVEVLVSGGRVWQGHANASFCPHAYGCRALVVCEGQTVLDVTDNELTVTVRVPEGRWLWLEYVLLVPENTYSPSYLREVPLDKSYDFISHCAAHGYHISPSSASAFCREAAASLSLFYNNGARPCGCHEAGATGPTCEPFGGQCPCRAHVIGRDCSRCATGYWGFPRCRPCDCGGRLCDERSGLCLCPPRTLPPDCLVCRPLAFGCHPLAGCEECNCSGPGVQELTDPTCNVDSGQCKCRPHVAGRRCDTCAPGFHGFPACRPCDCHRAGTLPSVCDPLTGRCRCKENVQGPRCDQCRLGTFSLDAANPRGCTRCFCFGATEQCRSAAHGRRELVDMEGWTLLSGDRQRVPHELRAEAELLGGAIAHTRPPQGNQMSVTFLEPEYPAPGQAHHGQLQLVEGSFRHTETHSPVSREELMLVLAGLEQLRVRALFSQTSSAVSLRRVALEVAGEEGEGPPASNVELCMCPASYRGASCQECAPGHYRDIKGLFLGRCVPCQCHGHSDRCLSGSGVCVGCQHHTEGDHCERCSAGFVRAGPEHPTAPCASCPCPLSVPSNNFAVGCVLRGGRAQCLCRPGYAGPSCERCAPGFFGNPLVLGSSCQPCDCSGNGDPNLLFSDCDPLTGACRGCLGHTAGPRCESCAPGFHGDALLPGNCTRCDCSPCGSEGCDPHSGRCLCKAGVKGQRCDRCQEGHFGFESCGGCQPCACGPAAASAECHPQSGQCHCRPGAGGPQCRECAPGHWGLPEQGCQRCRCQGGRCDPHTGRCTCPPGLSGARCDACSHQHQVPVPGGPGGPGVHCEVCDHCVVLLLDDLQRAGSLLPAVREQLRGLNASSVAWARLHQLEASVASLQSQLRHPPGPPPHAQQQLEALEQQSATLEQDTHQLDGQAAGARAQAGQLLDSTEATLGRARTLLAGIQAVDRTLAVARDNATLRATLQAASDAVARLSELVLGMDQAREEYERLAASLDGARTPLLDRMRAFSPASSKVDLVEAAEAHARQLDQLALNLSSIIRGVNQDRVTQRAIEAADAYSSILRAVQAAEGAAGQALQQASHAWTAVVQGGLAPRARETLANSSALGAATLEEFVDIAPSLPSPPSPPLHPPAALRILQFGHMSVTVEKQTIHETKGDTVAPGDEGLLNLRPDDFVFYVGGYPRGFTPPEPLNLPCYRGCIEMDTLNEEVVSLYNFEETFQLDTVADKPCARSKSTGDPWLTDGSYLDGSGFARISVESQMSNTKRFDLELRLVSSHGIIFFLQHQVRRAMTFHGHGFLPLPLSDVAPLSGHVYSGFGFRSTQDSGQLYSRASAEGPCEVSLQQGRVMLRLMRTEVKTQGGFADGAPHYVAFYSNSTGVWLYVDDQLQQTKPHPGPPPRPAPQPVEPPQLLLGGLPRSSTSRDGHNFSGCISNVFVHQLQGPQQVADLQQSAGGVNVSYGCAPHTRASGPTPRGLQATEARKASRRSRQPADPACAPPGPLRALPGAYQLGGAPSSHLELTVPGHWSHLSLLVRPQALRGLLALVAPLKGGTPSLVLSLHHGGHFVAQVEGPGLRLRVQSHQRARAGRWHSVSVRRRRSQLQLVVDGARVSGQAGPGQRLQATEGSLPLSLFVGGVPAGRHLLPVAGGSGFRGCVKRLRLDGRPLGAPRRLAGATPCVSGPLEEGLFFTGAGGVLSLALPGATLPVAGLELEVRPQTATGLLLHLGRSQAPPYLQLQLLDKQVLLRADDGTGVRSTWVTRPAALCDGQWHRLAVTHGARELRLEVDGQRNSTLGHWPAAPAGRAELHLGGLPEPTDAAAELRARTRPRPPAFRGCVRNLVANGSPVPWLHATHVQGAVGTGGCPAA